VVIYRVTATQKPFVLQLHNGQHCTTNSSTKQNNTQHNTEMASPRRGPIDDVLTRSIGSSSTAQASFRRTSPVKSARPTTELVFVDTNVSATRSILYSLRTTVQKQKLTITLSLLTHRTRA
jgi:hypothetical protein